MSLGGFLAGYGRAREGAADVGLKERREQAQAIENRLNQLREQEALRQMQQRQARQEFLRRERQRLGAPGTQPTPWNVPERDVIPQPRPQPQRATGEAVGRTTGQAAAQTTGQAATQQVTGQRPTAQSARERDAAAQQQAATQEAAQQQAATQEATQPQAGLAAPDGRLPDGTYLTMAEMWEQATPEEREAMARDQGLGASSPESWLLGGLGLARGANFLWNVGRGGVARGLQAYRTALSTTSPTSAAARPLVESAERALQQVPSAAPAIATLGAASTLDAAAQSQSPQATGLRTPTQTVEEKTPDLVESGDPGATQQALDESTTPSGIQATRAFENTDTYLADQTALFRDIPYLQEQRRQAATLFELHMLNDNFEAAANALSAMSSIDQGLYAGQGMLAINEFRQTGYTDRINAVLSYYNQADTRIVPNQNGTWNVEVGGYLAGNNLTADEITRSAKLAIDASARNAAAEASALYQQEAIKFEFESRLRQLDIRGDILRVQAEGLTAQRLEVLKSKLGPNIEVLGETETGILIYDKNLQQAGEMTLNPDTEQLTFRPLALGVAQTQAEQD